MMRFRGFVKKGDVGSSDVMTIVMRSLKALLVFLGRSVRG